MVSMHGHVSRCKIASALHRIDLRKTQTYWNEDEVSFANSAGVGLNSDGLCRDQNATCIKQPTFAPRCDIGMEITPHSAVYKRVLQEGRREVKLSTMI